MSFPKGICVLLESPKLYLEDKKRPCRYDGVMEIVAAQKDVRETFMGGFAGQLVSAVLWSVSAAACTWHSFLLGEWILILGGFLIFPLTQLLLRSMGHAYALPKGHPMNALGIQVAFTLPLTLPLVIGIAALHPVWFYPAFMIVLGAHYLPFIFMYGMWQFGVLSATLIVSGVAIAMYVPAPVSLGAWLTAVLLFAFAFVGRRVAFSDISAA
ncbi:MULTISPECIES: hypothetical protein [Acidobacteriaceae]|uniref:DUF7010 family protein n=1 Tax=Acidobacteriaceae TaxID=204434 RepID=UPI00131B956B|nr:MULTISPECIES: hypothetical protein [Acidobacteriaceae]MDW5265626.1 hypothetical protein [Edaphobacter sp.]